MSDTHLWHFRQDDGWCSLQMLYSGGEAASACISLESDLCPVCENTHLRAELSSQRAVVEAAREQARLGVIVDEFSAGRRTELSDATLDKMTAACRRTEQAIRALDGVTP